MGKCNYNRPAFLALTLLCLSSLAKNSLEAIAIHRIPDLPYPTLIAHAGGGIDDNTYTNSIEALNLNYRNGHRVFEIDFRWTSDGHPVAIHDWNKSVQRYFGLPTGQLTLEEFKNANRWSPYTHLTLEKVMDWTQEHSDITLVTDFKNTDNLKGLTIITEDYPHLVPQIVPQIFHLNEYEPARNLGFGNVILALYESAASNAMVVDFAKDKDNLAVSISDNREERGLVEALTKINVPTYVHTLNNVRSYKRARVRGAVGIYTDFLTPDQVSM